jgi:hypothetical protein
VVPHVAAHETHQRSWKILFIAPKRLLQQYRHLTDMAGQVGEVRLRRVKRKSDFGDDRSVDGPTTDDPASARVYCLRIDRSPAPMEPAIPSLNGSSAFGTPFAEVECCQGRERSRSCAGAIALRRSSRRRLLARRHVKARGNLATMLRCFAGGRPSCELNDRTHRSHLRA